MLEKVIEGYMDVVASQHFFLWPQHGDVMPPPQLNFAILEQGVGLSTHSEMAEWDGQKSNAFSWS
jgi:hypothetical protein